MPKLTGTTNWISFRNTFLFKLATNKDSCGFSLAYVLDTTPRAINTASENQVAVDSVDLDENDVYLTKLVYLGAECKADNKAV